jgi:hypothetical protein
LEKHALPCNNIVEQIRVVLNDRDCLIDYQLVKQTCGRPVGQQSLLVDCLRGLSAEELLSLTDRQIQDTCRPADDLSLFLHLKHLFAIQGALQVYTGRSFGGKGSNCTVARINREEDQVVVDADIDVDLVTERIRTCGCCTNFGLH